MAEYQKILNAQKDFEQQFYKAFNQNPQDSKYYSLFVKNCDDEAAIDACNEKLSRGNPDRISPYYIQKWALREHAIGDLSNAGLIILNNNPGVGADDLTPAYNAWIINMLQNNYEDLQRDGNGNQRAFYPFLDFFIRPDGEHYVNTYFPRRLIALPGQQIGNHLFDSLLNGNAGNALNVLKQVAPYIATAERFGYHSEKYQENKNFAREQAQNIAQKIINRMRDGTNPVIIIPRGWRRWIELLHSVKHGEVIDTYHNLFFSADYNQAHITPNTVIRSYADYQTAYNGHTLANASPAMRSAGWQDLKTAWNDYMTAHGRTDLQVQ